MTVRGPQLQVPDVSLGRALIRGDHTRTPNAGHPGNRAHGLFHRTGHFDDNALSRTVAGIQARADARKAHFGKEQNRQSQHAGCTRPF